VYIFRLSGKGRALNRKLTARQIQRAARFLQARGTLSGAALRALLYQRHGARGSVERIYAVVRELTGRRPRPYGRRVDESSRERAPATQPASIEQPTVAVEAGVAIESQLASLTLARDAALARAIRAEERYESDTARWMLEVDQLRTRLGQEGRSSYLIYGRDPRDVVRELEAKLAEAQRKILALETGRIDRVD
jgi:hypothetical protein